MIAHHARSAPPVRVARLEDADAFVDHVATHVAESGRQGSPHFAISRDVDAPEVRQGARARWSRRLDEPLWGRAWLLWTEPSASEPEQGRRVVGHLELRGGRVRAELHRATLAMGIQRAFTRQGHGMRLIDAAVRWARRDALLSWIDLGVFSTNLPARKLYARAGFVELGLHRDAFRIDDGVIIDDVQMTLAL